VTWLTAINDQRAQIAGMVLAGTPRDSMHMIDLLYSQDGGAKPEVVITDTGSYSDIVFGLVHLLGREYRPELADLPDQKLWRIGAPDGYGALEVAARGRVNLERVRRHWGTPAGGGLDPHRRGARLRRAAGAAARRRPDPAGRRDRQLRPHLQEPARADLRG
jgi:hypothetical protein